MDLYSITEMARILKIPESTTRFYRDRHQDFLPHTGMGRKRRYKKEVLEALRYICKLANNSRNAEELLQVCFNKQIDVTEITVVTTAGEHEELMLKSFADTLREVADQKKEIQSLREEIRELRENSNHTAYPQRLFRKNKNI